VASGIKYRPHGGKNSKTKSRTISWLNLQTKVEPEQPWGPSYEWRLARGHTKSAGFAVVHHKTAGLLD
jgi:hypothetical protein